MFKSIAFMFLCFWLGDMAVAQEDFEEDQFMNTLCTSKNMRNVAQCGELLPRSGADTVFKCGHDVTGSYSENMLQAAETFCYREDIRDTLFLCWERGLSGLHDSIRNEEERRHMNDFEVCLQTVMDRLFDA